MIRAIIYLLWLVPIRYLLYYKLDDTKWDMSSSLTLMLIRPIFLAVRLAIFIYIKITDEENI